MSQPTERVYISQKQNEQVELDTYESQQIQTGEKNEEQAKLSKEIETLQLKLSLLQKQSEHEQSAQITTPYSRMLAPHTTPPQAPLSWHKDF